MKLEINDIENDMEIKDFLRAKPRRVSTQMEHLIRLKVYCNFFGKTPSELIEEAEFDEENRIRMKKRHIRKYFIEYSEHLRNKGSSQYTISNHFSSIKSFYLNAEIELPNISINSKSEVKRTRNESIPSKEDIRIALKHGKFKYQAIILLMSSSGMGSGEIRNLTFGDYLKSIEDFIDYEDFDIEKVNKMLINEENIIGTWYIHRQKQGNNYYTFSSPESIKAISDYLVERQKRNGIIDNRELPLFENFGKKIPEHSFTKSFQRINDESGFGLSGRQRFFKSHSLRKYFASKLHKNGLSQIDIDWLLGHEINGVNASYIKSDPSSLKKEYLKVVKDLSIEKVITRDITTKEYDNILETLRKERDIRDFENITKDKEIKKLKEEKDKEMTEMKRELKVVKDLLLNKGVQTELNKR
jgi:integrase